MFPRIELHWKVIYKLTSSTNNVSKDRVTLEEEEENSKELDNIGLDLVSIDRCHPRREIALLIWILTLI